VISSRRKIRLGCSSHIISRLHKVNNHHPILAFLSLNSVTYLVVASDSEWRVTQEWQSIKVFSHDSLHINRVFLLFSFSSSLYCIIESTHGSPLSTIATNSLPTFFSSRLKLILLYAMYMKAFLPEVSGLCGLNLGYGNYNTSITVLPILLLYPRYLYQGAKYLLIYT